MNPEADSPASNQGTGYAKPVSRRRRYAAVATLAAAAALAAAFWMWPAVFSTRIEVIEFAMLEPRDTPTAVAVGPDDTVWFTIDFANAIGRIRDGKIERLTEPGTNLEPVGLTVAADGAAWYTDAAARQIQRISPGGEINSFALDTPIVKLGKIAAAADGSLWFAEATAYSITRLRNGKLKRHVVDSIRAEPYGVAVAPDGTIWATLRAGNQLLRITPDGAMKAFDIPTRGSSPTDVAVDSQGAVWFLEFRGNKVGRYAAGRFEEFPVGEGPTAGLTGLAVTADGTVWFAMLRQGSLGRLRDGRIERFRLPRESARPYSVAIDGEGNVWYADITGFVGKLPAAQAGR
jgi:virginiamycin B lyase